MRAGESVLLPPPERDPRPLPRWLGAVALLGLAVLLGSLLPAVLRHHHLVRHHEALTERATRQERELLRLRRALRDAQKDSFLREHALRELIHPPAPSRRASGPR